MVMWSNAKAEDEEYFQVLQRKLTGEFMMSVTKNGTPVIHIKDYLYFAFADTPPELLRFHLSSVEIS